MAVVYAIRNCLNDKFYIGATSLSAEKRWKQHIANAGRDVRSPLYNAIRKYGRERFEITTVYTVGTLSEAYDLEIATIAEFQANGNTLYNAAPGGNGGRIWTHEKKERLGKMMQGRKLSESTKKKISESLSGKKLSEEHRRSIARGLTKYEKHVISDDKRRDVINEWNRLDLGRAAAWRKEAFICESARCAGVPTVDIRRIVSIDFVVANNVNV